ncbi:hypothetical protein L228DRAFT_257910 [Xylona heveae TC161]|uniref:Uncharacterized protein n=1 Tax=Xylona heveae (strain CBS 132557 / TC161) TaxID=1328760 RepID=A0A165JPF5_XYLHT|nr:hypothetical protein L228DRAFT_257910 [Xylona heveae TC161]KZF26480.1 hypothetical protein L228DRAFT_257910 [Xylona heveae TC161]
MYRGSMAKTTQRLSAPAAFPPHSLSPNRTRQNSHRGRDALEAEDISERHSESSTLWRTPLQRSTQGALSPTLPLLPSLRDLAGVSRPSSPQEYQTTGSSLYFTASWGSPYQYQDLGSNARSTYYGRRGSTGSDVDGDLLARPRLRVDTVDPAQSSPFGADFASRRSPTSTSLAPARLAFLGLNRGLFRGYTEEWVRQNSVQSHSERENWWSDDSETNDAPATEHSGTAVDGEGSAWFEPQEYPDTAEELLTPTLASFGQKRETTRRRSTSRENRARKHRSIKSNDTLKQIDFLNKDYFSKDCSADMLASQHAVSAAGSEELNADDSVAPSSSAPLAEPQNKNPVAETGASNEQGSEAQLDSVSPQIADAAPKSTQAAPSKTVETTDVEPPRNVRPERKRVVWRGRYCAILVPPDVPRGADGEPLKLLDTSAVSGRLRHWEEQGFNTRGFDQLAEEEEFDSGAPTGQSRAIYPDIEEMQNERSSRQYNISFPNKKEWDAYVNFLNEEKLRALGVSFDDEEPLSAASPLSSQEPESSGQWHCAAQPPPIGTSIEAQQAEFSPLLPSSLPDETTQTSPLKAHVSQFPPMEANTDNQQTPLFGPGEQQIFRLPSHQYSPSISRGWSPQHHYFSSRKGSAMASSPAVPSVSGGGTILTPNSMLGIDPAQERPMSSNDLLSHMQQRQQELQLQMLQQQQQQQETLSAQHWNSLISDGQQEALDQNFEGEVKITPEGHPFEGRIRPSTHEHEYHLEESIQRQMEEEDDYRAHTNFRFGEQGFERNDDSLRSDHTELARAKSNSEKFATRNPSEASTIHEAQEQASFMLHHPQPHSKAHSLSKSVFGRDGLLHAASPPNLRLEVMDSQNLSQAEPKSEPHAYISEIDTNPSLQGTPAPGLMSSASDDPQHLVWPGTQSSAADPVTLPLMFDPQSFKHTSKSSIENNNLNSAPNNPWLNGNGPVATHQVPFSNRQSMGSNHSSIQHHPKTSSLSGASKFNVDAPAFTPGTTKSTSFSMSEFKFSPAVDKAPELVPSFQAALSRSEVKPSDIIKPATKSKAIPIVRPDEVPKKPADSDKVRTLDEDESRKKRIRCDDDENEPELLKKPARPLAETSQGKLGSNSQSDLSENKENAAPSGHAQMGDGLPVQSTQGKQGAISTQGVAGFPSANLTSGPETEQRLQSSHGSRGSTSKKSRTASKDIRIATDREDGLQNVAGDINTSSNNSLQGSDGPQQTSDPPPIPEKSEKRNESPHRPSDGLASSKDKPGEFLPEIPLLDNADFHRLAQSSFHEIDAVMRQLNEDDPDLGVEKNTVPWSQSSPTRTASPDKRLQSPIPCLPNEQKTRSDAPSPSPRRHEARLRSFERRSDSIDGTLDSTVPIHRLNYAEEIPVSEWDDFLSSGEEEKLRWRSDFFNMRVNEMVGELLQLHLDPVERSLASIHHHLNSFPRRPLPTNDQPSVSGGTANSDADDEDEDEEACYTRQFSTTAKASRKMEKLKAAIFEALAQSKVVEPNLNATLSSLQQGLEEIKSSQHQVQRPAFEKQHIETIVREVIAQSSMTNVEAPDDQDAQYRGKLDDAERRIEKEIESRRRAEEELIKTKRSLEAAEEVIAQERQSAEKLESKIENLSEEHGKDHAKSEMRREALEEAEKNITDLAAKNLALESTIQEYRISHENWLNQIDEANRENKNLKATMDKLRAQTEESIRAREAVRGRFDKLQEEMASAASDIAREQANWRKKDEDHQVKFGLVAARLEAEARTRERLEREIERLEAQEAESMKMKVVADQTQKFNARLEETVAALRVENIEFQKVAARAEREASQAREAGRMELHRTRVVLEADLRAAKMQVDIVRAELESELVRTENRLEHMREEANTMKSRSEYVLQEAERIKEKALKEAHDYRERSLRELQTRYERSLEDLKQQHGRALGHAVEDKERSAEVFKERLDLSEAKVTHFQDLVKHLEEKLEIAKSAAHAAAQAAQSARVSQPSSSSSPTTGDDTSPLKISPQALRESIFVLQEQLQERESRIESLEQELAAVDRNAPKTIKERDMEIAWLRELLGVRLGELEDIVGILSQPEFDKNAVRDAAIRLKANLEMEQQEKERAMNGQTFPSLSAISNFASPKVLPLAAAIGNWRKGRVTSTASTTADNAGDQTPSASQQTPSKSSPSAHSFLSGLLTPPGTNNRFMTPINKRNVSISSTNSAASTPQNDRPLLSSSSSRFAQWQRQSSQPLLTFSARQAEKQPLQDLPPATPPLLRKGSYDQDAEANVSPHGGFYDDDDSTVDGNPIQESRAEDSFGPAIGAETELESESTDDNESLIRPSE